MLKKVAVKVDVEQPDVRQADSKLELSEHLPYLFRHIYAQLEAASAGRLAQFGVNVAVWRILAVLWQHGDLAHRELADLTSIEVSTLSRVSKAVQRDGLIRRKRTQADQRTVRVTLTDKGRDLVQQIIPSALTMQARMVGDLSAADVRTLKRILPIIAANLGAYRETDTDLAVAMAPSPAPAPVPVKPKRVVAKTPKSTAPKSASAKTAAKPSTARAA